MGTTTDGTNAAGAGGNRPTYEELVEENRRLRLEHERLRQRIEELTRLVEELRCGAKRQAAPFRKQEEPSAEPKRPGRKSGRRHGPHAHRRAPPRIDEHYDVPLPAACPHCGSPRLSETHVTPQYQTEIPRRVIYRQFQVHAGRCDQCGRVVQGRHALQTSSAEGAAASQFGPNVHAALALCNKQLGLSHGKCVKLLSTLFEGLSMARGTSARSLARTGRRCQPAYEQLRGNLHDAAQAGADETGWRVAGRPAWLHVFIGPRETCYVIDPTRSGKPAEDLLGLDWPGTLVHDGWSVYDRLTHADHQQCLAHLQRRCREMLAIAERGAVRLPRAILNLIDRAFALRRVWRGHRLSRDELAERGLGLACELEQLTSGHFTHDPNRRLAKHVLDHIWSWFWFLIDPTIDATNYRAEQALRPAVVNRKVWGGNRTWSGARTQSVLVSVIRTCEQRAQSAFDFLLGVLCRSPPQLLTA